MISNEEKELERRLKKLEEGYKEKLFSKEVSYIGKKKNLPSPKENEPEKLYSYEEDYDDSYNDLNEADSVDENPIVLNNEIISKRASKRRSSLSSMEIKKFCESSVSSFGKITFLTVCQLEAPNEKLTSR